MKKILYITVSPRKEQSRSKMIGDYYLSKLVDYDIKVLDLGKEKMPFLTSDIISYVYGYKSYDKLGKEDKLIADLQIKLINQIKGVERILISVPMWNFGEPAILKAYFDLVIKINDTFKVNNDNYIPLLTNIKKVDFVGSRGGDYSSLHRDMDILEPTTKTLIRFITGITHINTYWLEGVKMYDKITIEKEFEEIKNRMDNDI